MPNDPPPELSALLGAKDSESRERAWAGFLERHSQLLLRTAGSYGSDYDTMMDRYQFVLAALQEDDFKRLRLYKVHGRSTFRGWLVVVSRRLSLDFDRSRYGRASRAADTETPEQERSARRKLVDLAGVNLDVGLLAHRSASDPERALRETQLTDALEAVMSSLEPRDQLLLTLRFEDGLSVRQVADVMRYPSVFHVYRQLKRVLHEVRERLLNHGVSDAKP
jgi:RNA polymerase sigma factor (sigma-70 family)